MTKYPHPKLDPVLRILVVNDGPHLELVPEGAGHVVRRLARLHGALDTCASLLLAQHAHQRPPGTLGRSYQVNSES